MRQILSIEFIYYVLYLLLYIIQKLKENINSVKEQVNDDNTQAINTFVNNYIVKNIKQKSNQLFQESIPTMNKYIENTCKEYIPTITTSIQNLYDKIFKN